MNKSSFFRQVRRGAIFFSFLFLLIVPVESQETTAAFKAKLGGMAQKMESLNGKKEAELFSPYNFREFSKLQKKVVKRIDTGGRVSNINEELNEMQVRLDKVIQNIGTAHTMYADLLRKRYELSVRYNSELFHKSMGVAEIEFIDGGEEIEDDDLKGAEKQKKSIRKALFKAEVVGAREFYLGTIRDMENKTDNLRPGKKFPDLLERAQICKESLDEFIKGRPGDSEEIEKRMLLCNGVWFKLAAFLKFDNKVIGNNWEKEEYVRYINTLLNDLYQSSNAVVNVQHPIQKKLVILMDMVAGNQKIIMDFKAELSHIMPELEELERLRKDDLRRKKLKEKLLTIRAIFDDSIALVRRENSDVVIDVYGLTFKLGSYEITSDGFPLLEKIKNAVALFQGEKISLIGHTDSDGNPGANKRLSKQRAETLMKFLKSAGVLNKDNISIDGKGDESPLHPNTSWENKRQNRRVEVRIRDVAPL